MTNIYRGSGITSEKIVTLMRDINALQAGFDIKMTRYVQRRLGTFGISSGANGLATDSDGNIYVSGSGKLVKFDSNMRFIKGIATGSTFINMACSSTLLYASSGGLAYGIYDFDLVSQGVMFLRDPGGIVFSWGALGIAIDSSDNMYVAARFGNNAGTGEVQIYNSMGTLQSYFSATGIMGIAFDGTYIYAPIYTNFTGECIRKYQTDGTLVATYSSSTDTAEEGKLNTPTSIAVDSAGSIFVIDANTGGTPGGRVQKFDSSGAYVSQFWFPLLTQYGLCAIGEDRLLVSSSSQTIMELSLQTEWKSYTHTAESSLGTSDGGVSVPATDAISEFLSPRLITDMRRAVEGLARLYDNGSGGPLAISNILTTAMGDRTAYGATGGSLDRFTRPLEAMGDGHLVIGDTDGHDYWCLVPHNATAATRPSSGANYADYWIDNGTTGLGRAWIEGEYYLAPGSFMSGSAFVASIVPGDVDGDDYICEDDHGPTTATRPTSGANWRTKWRALGTTGYGAAWTTAGGRQYACNRVYDIDLGEIYECVEHLKTLTPL